MHATNRSLRDRCLLSTCLTLVLAYMGLNLVSFHYLTLAPLGIDTCFYYTLVVLFILSYARTVLSDPGKVRPIIENEAVDESILEVTNNAFPDIPIVQESPEHLVEMPAL